MNQSFRVIFQAATGTFVAVSELTKSNGKTKSSSALRGAVVAGVLALSAASAMASESCELSDGNAGVVNALGACVAQDGNATSAVGPMMSIMDTSTPTNSLAGGTANSAQDLAIGSGGVTNSQGAIAISGSLAATATGNDAIAIGTLSIAAGQQAMALGVNAHALSVNATAVGAGSNATGSNGATALGMSSNAIASGASSNVSANYSVAIGTYANAAAANSVALGYGSQTGLRDNVVSVGSAAAQRQIINLAAGTAATDAANFGQLTATGASIATALGGGSIVNADGTITTPTYTLQDGTVVTGVGGVVNNFDQRVSDLATAIGSGTVGLVQQDALNNISVAASTGGTLVDFTGTDGARILNGVGPGAIASGSTQAVNGGQISDMKAAWDAQLQSIVDNADAAIGIIGSRVDDLTSSVGQHDQQLGDLNDRVGLIETGIADGTIGGGGLNPANGNAQVGTGADASGKDATAIGNGSNASGDNSTAVGNGSTASGSNSTATGAGSIASGSNSTANGANASATGENSTALGANSSATGSNSVAIGEGSVADRDNSVSFGSAGNERQLTNVADGTAPTDAVNKRQLDGAISGVNSRIDRLDTRVDEMGAMSTASAQMALSTAGLAGTNRLGVGIGAQNGQSALALGYQRVFNKGARTLNVGGSASTRGTVSVGAGAGFAW